MIGTGRPMYCHYIIRRMARMGKVSPAIVPSLQYRAVEIFCQYFRKPDKIREDNPATCPVRARSCMTGGTALPDTDVRAPSP